MTEPTTTESRILFQRAQQSEIEAQSQLHDRYAQRLLGLIRSRLRRQYQARFDAEDVVNSAFRSFFVALEKGRFELPTQGGLWPLLAQISLHKLHRAHRHHTRIRRDVNNQHQLAAELPNSNEHDVGAELSLRDELAYLAQKLPSGAVDALEYSIQGFEQAEIANKLGCTTRTVRRYLAEARTLLKARLSQLADVAPTAIATDGPAAALDGLKVENYLLRRMIGMGVFGKVYLATEKTTGTDVAVKYLRKRWTQDSLVVQRFDHEIALLGQLDIDGVVPCYGGGHTNDSGRFLVMKYIEGETLAARRRCENQSESAVRHRFARLADTLGRVHQRGITHCDLKPTNILIDLDDRWWLTDFGLAQQEWASIAQVAGTPAYMAPEQLDPFFGPIGPWTDLYAIGKMLLELLSGKSLAVLAASPATADQWIEWAELRISRELTGILRQLLQRSVADRLTSAEQLAQLLRANA